MNIDKNLIKYWDYLCESEEDRLDEATYGSTTKSDVERKLSYSKEFESNAWVEGKDTDFAIYVRVSHYHSPIDSNGYDFDDDGDYEKYIYECEQMFKRLFDVVGLPEDEFIKEFAYYEDDYYERLPADDYTHIKEYEVYKIVPKRYASKQDKRYYANKTAELYEKAMKIAKMYNKDVGETQKRQIEKIYRNQITDVYETLETEYHLTAHSSESFDDFLEQTGGYSLGEIRSDIEKIINER